MLDTFSIITHDCKNKTLCCIVVLLCKELHLNIIMINVSFNWDLLYTFISSVCVTEHNWVTLLHGENNLSLTLTFDHNLQSTL